MRMMSSRVLHGTALALAVAGAVNWGSVGLLRVNLLSRLLRRSPVAERLAYFAVGLAGVWVASDRILPRVRLALGMRNEDAMQALSNNLLVGTPMPSVSGETLSGRKVTIPRDTMGKVTFLAMGFSYDSRFNVEDWMRAFEAGFARDPDVAFYEMAMIDGPFHMFGGAINQGMRRGAPLETHDHVITVYASQAPLRHTIRAARTSDTWVYLLDRSGQVLFQCGGAFDSERFQELTWVTDAALARAKAPEPEIMGT
jgi:uncharacterized membrane protein YuzA (DUF378 family)